MSLLLFASLALSSASIGHPVAGILASGTGLTVDFAELPVQYLTVDRCDDTTETFEVMEVLDLVAGDTITLPEGDICGLQLDLGGRLHVAGDGNSGGSFSLSLAVGVINIPVSPALEVVSGSSAAIAVRIADPNWITAAGLGLSSGHVHVGPSSTLHDGLRDSVRWDSAVIQ
jgi:hypothetical protein